MLQQSRGLEAAADAAAGLSGGSCWAQSALGRQLSWCGMDGVFCDAESAVLECIASRFGASVVQSWAEMACCLSNWDTCQVAAVYWPTAYDSLFHVWNNHHISDQMIIKGEVRSIFRGLACRRCVCSSCNLPPRFLIRATDGRALRQCFSWPQTLNCMSLTTHSCVADNIMPADQHC